MIEKSREEGVTGYDRNKKTKERRKGRIRQKKEVRIVYDIDRLTNRCNVGIK